MELFQEEAIKVLRMHYDNLKNLAHGKLLSVKWNERISQGPICEKKCKFDKETVLDNIRDYLSNRSNHNSICENLDKEDNVHFYCQVLTSTDSYRVEFLIDAAGIFTVRGSYGENEFIVPKAYEYAIANYLNAKNAKHKYGTLYLGDADKGIGFHCKIHTLLLDGPIGDKTIEFLEQILLNILSDSIEKVEMFGMGILPRNKRESEKELLEKLMMLEKTSKQRFFDQFTGFKRHGLMPEPSGGSPIKPEETLDLEKMMTPDDTDTEEVTLSDFAEQLDTAETANGSKE